MANIHSPLLTCEAVISETCFLLRGYPFAIRAIFEWIKQGTVGIAFRLENETESVAKLMSKYADVPMSLADACLVRMTELLKNSKLLTLDSDFQIYRKHRRQMIQTIMPDKL